MADGADLLGVERAADAHDDRGRGLRRLAREQRALGQHQMDAGGLHPVDGADGAGEFALERAQMVDVLHEARGAERVGLVEDLVADAAALWQAALGELHAQPGDLLFRHHDYRAFVAQFERDRLALQLLDDAGRVFGRQIREQGRHLRRGGAHDDESEKADQRCRHGDHRHHPRSAQPLEETCQTLQRTSPVRFGARRFGGHADWAEFAYAMVSIWLISVNRHEDLSNAANRPSRKG